ncbi:MAG: hypothetical protein AB7F25_07020 [Deferribacterales bacterium]
MAMSERKKWLMEEYERLSDKKGSPAMTEEWYEEKIAELVADETARYMNESGHPFCLGHKTYAINEVFSLESPQLGNPNVMDQFNHAVSLGMLKQV